MGFKEAADRCKSELHACIESNDMVRAKTFAIQYSAIMRQAHDRTESYRDRAVLISEAERYEYVAAVIAKWGRCDELYRALGVATVQPKPCIPSARGRTAPPKSTAKKPAAKEAPVLSVPPRAAAPISTPIPVPTPVPAPAPASAPLPAMPAAPMQTPSASGVEWVADAMERYKSAVRIVEVSYAGASGVGTGFFISKDGYFLTNHHVVFEHGTEAHSITVVSDDGSKRYRATVVEADKKRDVALLKVSDLKETIQPLRLLEDDSSVRPGSEVLIIGNGLAFGLAPLTGIVKFVKSKEDGNLVHTCPTNNGDSGSPVLTRDGGVIGIHKSSTTAQIVGHKSLPVKGFSNATPVSDIRNLFKKWKVKIEGVND